MPKVHFSMYIMQRHSDVAELPRGAAGVYSESGSVEVELSRAEPRLAEQTTTKAIVGA